MVRLEFDAQGVFDQLDRARAALSDMTPVFEDIAELMVAATRRRFQAGVGPDGRRWREKSPATLAAYVRRGHGARPRPLIGPSEQLGEQIVPLVTSSSAEIGSPLIYSGVMQHGAAKGAFGATSRGAPIPWGDIPARVWLGISAEDERNILDIVDEHLELALGE